jgi:hypothetical protein
MTRKPSLIVFSGGMRETPVERLVGAARDAAALDTIERACHSGAFAQAILATDDADVAVRVPAGVEVDIESGEFDFGKRLRRIVADHRIERPLYIGGGSAPLLETGELGELAERLAGSDQIVVSNNFFSADLVGWTPGAALDALGLVPSDNRLPQLLHHGAGLPSWSMERTIASQFDIDTPTDLKILKLYGANGPRLRDYLAACDLDLSGCERAMASFLVPVTVLVAGRISSAVWQYLEREAVCRTRILSEERGMQADGRERSGQVRSMLGFLMEKTGVDGLLCALAELGDAVFLDSRVLCAHARVFPSRADRFLSDLGRWQEVTNPLLRELTRAARVAAVPVVLGGHSLVSGGIMALVQAAWDAHDRAQGDVVLRNVAGVWADPGSRKGSYEGPNQTMNDGVDGDPDARG